MDAVIEPERLVQISQGQDNPRMRMNAAPGSRAIRTLKEVQLQRRNAEAAFRGAWKQVMAVVGSPDEQPGTLDGQLSVSTESRDWDAVQNQILSARFCKIRLPVGGLLRLVWQAWQVEPAKPDQPTRTVDFHRLSDVRGVHRSVRHDHHSVRHDHHSVRHGRRGNHRNVHHGLRNTRCCRRRIRRCRRSDCAQIRC